MSKKSPLAANTKYYVTSWDTGAVLATFDDPQTAKKDAKARGAIYSRFTGIMPVAYVAADYCNWNYALNCWTDISTTRCMFYNPRFK